MARKLGGYYGQKYHWTGWPTHRQWSWECYADTPMELYDILVDKGIISTVDGDPMDIRRLENAGYTEEEFFTEYESELDDYDFYTVFDDIAKIPDLSDNEILDVIAEEDGNAYYQLLEIYNPATDEYEGG